MINFERRFIMDENIQYGFRTKDGEIHAINVRGADNITEAVLEVAVSLMKGGVEADGKVYQASDIAGYDDIPG